MVCIICIVAQDVGYVAVRLLYHHVNGLHDTILHRVVAQLEYDMRCAFQEYYGIAVIIESLRGCKITSQHVGSNQAVLRHLHRGVHVVYQMVTGNGIAVLVGEL